MSKKDYLTEDTINPPDQLFICVSFDGGVTWKERR